MPVLRLSSPACLSRAALAACAIGAVVSAPALGRETPRLTPERLYGEPALDGPTARAARLSPDGRLATFLRASPGGDGRLDLWAYDLESGEERILLDSATLSPEPEDLSEAEIARRERQRIRGSGLVEYAWDAQGRAVIAPLDGDIYLADVTQTPPAVRQLTDTEAREYDAKVSPAGGYVSFVRDGAFAAVDLESGEAVPLSPEADDAVRYGVAEFIADEEMERHTGSWWSPDDRYVAYTRVDERPVDIIPRVDIGAAGATIVEQRYPRAGAANAIVDLLIHDVERRVVAKADLGQETDVYLARVDWLDADTLIVQRQNRDQTRLDVLAVNAADGRSTLLFSETSETWLNLHDDFRAIDGGARFLWTSERSGYRHIYLYAADGALIRQVTAGEWIVNGRGGGIMGVDQDAGLVYFAGFKDTPLERHLYRVSYEAPGEPERVTEAGGSWRVAMSPGAQAYIGTDSRPDQPPRTGVYGTDGALRTWVVENALDDAHPYAPYLPRHTDPEFVTLQAADGQTLHAALYLPEGCGSDAPCPAIQYVYGGPGVQIVDRAWGGTFTQMLVHHGYAVFELDNRGSTNRGVAFEAPLHRDMGGPEVADQLAGLAWLKTRPEIDPARVGVYGWSYGGYMTLKLLGAAPDAFAAGVSGAPVTDWALYDTHYTERYMGKPIEQVAAYEGSSVFAHLDAFGADPLLIIHGMADDNVIFENTTRLIAALQERAVPFETMVYPGQRHGIRGATRRTHLAKTILAFFDRHLQPDPEPAP